MKLSYPPVMLLTMFDKFTQWLKSLFAETPAAPAPILLPPQAVPAVLPQPISDFVNSTRMGSPQQLTQMGFLANQIAPWEFSEICENIAQGAAYVQQRFGTFPKAIVLTDDPFTNFRYNLEAQTIFVPRQAISTLLNLRYTRQSKTEPYVLSSNQMATLYAVEEAYHHYQHMSDPARTAALAAAQKRPTSSDYTPGYTDNPLELEAEQVVQQALKEFGFDRYDYTMVPGARPYQWQQRVQQMKLLPAPTALLAR